jgi:hypothetical protein
VGWGQPLLAITGGHWSAEVHARVKDDLARAAAEHSYAGFRVMFTRIAAFNQSGETPPIHRLGWWRPVMGDDTIRGLVRAYEDHQHDRSPCPAV